MPVSSDIYSMVGRGVQPVEDPQNALLKALKLQGAQQEMQQQRELGTLKMDEYRRGVDRSNKLQQLLAGDYADDDARAGALVKGGFLKEGEEYLKGRADVAGKRATTAKTLTEVDVAKLGQHNNLLASVQSPEDGLAWIQLGVQNGAIKPENAPMLAQTFQRAASPEQLRDTVNKLALGMKDYIEKNKPILTSRSLGDRSQLLATPGLGGATTVANEAQINQSPDNAASNARQAADAAAARAVQLQIAGQTDARAREGLKLQGERLAFDKTKPAEEKPLNDTQSKALLFGSRMREAGKVLDALAKDGTSASVPGSRAGYGIGSTITALSSSKQQQLDQAKRDFVNAVLRRESGAVIADSEFENADKQYFPQIGDSKEVIAQKKRNRELATDGILQEVPTNRRNGLQPQAQMPTADDIRKQADNILKGG